jgi:hypothetical protein
MARRVPQAECLEEFFRLEYWRVGGKIERFDIRVTSTEDLPIFHNRSITDQ